MFKKFSKKSQIEKSQLYFYLHNYKILVKRSINSLNSSFIFNQSFSQLNISIVEFFILQFDCGHRCRANCHSGPCPNPEACKKKVKVTCPCKRIKKEIQCEIMRKNLGEVKCDEVCAQKMEEERKKNQVLEEQRKKEEELKNKKELEKYEKMFQQKKKNKERKVRNYDDERSFFDKYRVIIICVLVAVVAFVMFVVLYK